MALRNPNYCLDYYDKLRANFTDEEKLIAIEDEKFLAFMYKSVVVSHKIKDLYTMIVMIRVMTTQLPPINCTTGKPLECVDLNDLDIMIRNGILTPDGIKLQRPSFCKPVLNDRVVEWDSIYISVINDYKSRGITDFEMMSDAQTITMPIIDLVYGIADDTTILDTRTNYNPTALTRTAMYNFHNLYIVTWAKNSKYRWIIDSKVMMVDPNIAFNHTSQSYQCDSIDQFTIINSFLCSLD